MSAEIIGADVKNVHLVLANRTRQMAEDLTLAYHALACRPMPTRVPMRPAKMLN